MVGACNSPILFVLASFLRQSSLLKVEENMKKKAIPAELHVFHGRLRIRPPIPSCLWAGRFSSPVCVASVHVRASSVLRLVVHPGGNVSGSQEGGGKAVTVVPLMPVNSIDSRHGGAASEPGAQDIDVDVRGVPR